MSVENKIDLLINEAESEREAAQPGYVTPEAKKAIDKAGIEKPNEHDAEAPELDTEEGPEHIASILNNLGAD